MPDPKQLQQMLAGDPHFGAVAALCDEYNADERLAAIRMLGKPEMAKLYEKAGGQGAFGLDYLVPEGKSEVPWNGKNSLPAFSHFCKVFAKNGTADTLAGRNDGPVSFLIGPGYYTATVMKPGQFLVDYTREPAEPPAGWPAVKSNGAGFSFFVFRNMHDYVRPVGKNVAIGAAYDGPSGKPKNQYFALARGERVIL